MKKVALFVFNDDPMCFIHVLLNALDMEDRNYEAKIIIEGSATKLIPEMGKKDHPLHVLWEKVKNYGLVEGACKACSKKMEVLHEVEAQDIPVLDEMSGHPSMATYRDDGFEVMIF